MTLSDIKAKTPIMHITILIVKSVWLNSRKTSLQLTS